MAEHFYRLKSIYRDDMRLIYTDTDSFVMEIKLPVNEALNKIRDPKYEEYFEFPDSKVKNVPGRLALEKTCKFFYAFASKHYIMDKEEKCKGVPKNKRTNCTGTKVPELKTEREYYSIVSKNHQIMIRKNIKKLKYEDDKKYYIGDEAYPYGYKGMYSYEKQ